MNIDPEVYLKAAKLIEVRKELFCCWAINTASARHEYFKQYEKLFNPNNGDYNWFGNVHDISNQNDRVMSLLLMHEIAKDLKRGEE